MKAEVKHFPVDRPEDQKIVYLTELENSATGEVERIEIEVRGFKDPSAATAAVVQFAEGLMEVAMQGGPAAQAKADPMDRAIENLLNLDDN